jgi:hypothetical protein
MAVLETSGVPGSRDPPPPRFIPEYRTAHPRALFGIAPEQRLVAFGVHLQMLHGALGAQQSAEGRNFQ